MKAEQESGIGTKGRGKRESLGCISFVKGYHRIFSSFCYHGGRQGDRETSVEGGGHKW